MKTERDRMKYGYNGTAATALGIVQMVLGTGSLISGIICIFQLTSFGFIGHGIWCGLMFILAGSLVTSAGVYSKDSLVIAGTVCSVIAMLFSVALAAISSLGLYYDISQDYCNHTAGVCSVDPFVFCSNWVNEPQCLDENGRNVSVILAAILTVFAVLEFAIAMAAACLICSCCSVKENKVDDLHKTIPVQPIIIRVPPSTGTHSNVHDFDDSKSHRIGVPPEWRLSYAN